MENAMFDDMFDHFDSHPECIVSLADAGLEEDDEHAHGIFHSNEGSIYSYTAWFYDGDESAFGIM
jgi:hypothetical protein